VIMAGKPWFVPKSYGYGAVPSSWQGWAMVLAFAAVIAVLAFLCLGSGEPTAGGIALFIGGTLAAVVVLVVVAKAKTEGEWRWRSGRERER
jgi:hypothetical protein